MRPGSVCRHLKIAGRAIISRFFHVTSQQTPKVATHPDWVYALLAQALDQTGNHDEAEAIRARVKRTSIDFDHAQHEVNKVLSH